MRYRVMLLAAAIVGTLLTAGCYEVNDSSREQAICFRAGSPLLNDADTKTADPKTAFTSGDAFYVIGAKTVSGQLQAVFGAVNAPQLVSFNGTNWTYSPTKSWDTQASSYGFLAIARPSDATGTIYCDPSSFPFAASVAYDPTVRQYDLMVACDERTDPQQFKSEIPVHLQFYHTLSAVSVVVYNDSPIQDIVLNSYGFRNLYTTATLTVEHFEETPVSSWMVTRFDNSTVLGQETNHTIAGGGTNHYPTTLAYDLMIPQDLDPVNPANRPKLVLDYSYNDGQNHRVETSINLRDIVMRGSDQPITSWQQGVKYNYEIHIRYGGGIRVHVVTTPWEEVNAETPGLLI